MIYLLFFYLQFSIINYNTLKTERGMTMANSIDELLFDITPEILQLAKLCEESNAIEKELYTEYQVKRGLRDLNGKGVLAGLTNISDVCASQIVDGEEVPCEGNLYYRGYNIKDLVNGFLAEGHYGFEDRKSVV